MEKNLNLALIGREVSSSPSPILHHFILGRMGINCRYERISISESELAIRAKEFFLTYDGLNITMPYKRTILPYLADLKGSAAVFGAVNTVKTKEREGYNTDGGGFSMMLEAEGIDVRGRRTLVLGAGGAGRSCIRTLTECGAEVYVYEKNPSCLQEVYRAFGSFTPLITLGQEKFDVVVNCTGVGSHESAGKLPIVRTSRCELPFCGRFFDGCKIAVDLIYDPKQSAFLEAAESCGVRALNGMGMLFFQAYLADCIFLGRDGSLEEATLIKKRYEEDIK